MKILFLCTGNSCRSQMAEGLAKAFKGGIIEAYSAGTVPKGIDPRAVKVMKEIGIDISGFRSKSLNEFTGWEFDYVVTLCGDAQEKCPVFSGKTKIVHAGFDDPPLLAAGAKDEEEALACYRTVRDKIRVFVEGMPGSIDAIAGDFMIMV